MSTLMYYEATSSRGSQTQSQVKSESWKDRLYITWIQAPVKVSFAAF